MEHYSKNQVKILKNLEKGSIDLSAIRQDEALMQSFWYLQQEGLIFVGHDEQSKPRTFLARILPKGEAYLECLRIDERRFWLPLLLSCIASLTALMSLAVSLLK